jgi:hypothetical protein
LDVQRTDQTHLLPSAVFLKTSEDLVPTAHLADRQRAGAEAFAAAREAVIVIEEAEVRVAEVAMVVQREEVEAEAEARMTTEVVRAARSGRGGGMPGLFHVVGKDRRRGDRRL